MVVVLFRGELHHTRQQEVEGGAVCLQARSLNLLDDGKHHVKVAALEPGHALSVCVQKRIVGVNSRGQTCV